MAAGSKTAVVMAITGNSVVTLLKFGAAFLTHSASMMNEAVHSMMDTANQVFLLMGLRQGGRPADRGHAFGHGQEKYLWNLWSAIGLFSIGSGFGLAHAWHSYRGLGDSGHRMVEPVSLFGATVDPIWVLAAVLLFALLAEGYVLIVAVSEFRRQMHADNATNPFSYLLQSDDPTLIAVLLEDSVAVMGVFLAALGIGLSRLTGNLLWDIGFSVVIALLLAVVAVLLGWINMRYLTAIRDDEAEAVFKEVVESHPEVERWHDLRSIVVDDTHTVLVAEVELREEAMVSGLAERIDQILAEFNRHVPSHRLKELDVLHYLRTRAVIQATLERTEQITDELEQRMRALCPQIYHVTLEVEGITGARELSTV